MRRRGEAIIEAGIIGAEEKVGGCAGALVIIRLVKRGRAMCLDIVNQVSIWAWGNVTIRGMDMRKRTEEKEREKIIKKKLTKGIVAAFFCTPLYYTDKASG